jgi:hypothetical protein
MSRDQTNQRLRLYSGRPHPSDPSAFIIPYSLDGQRGELIGQIDRSGLTHFTSTGPLRLSLAGSGVASP